MRIAHINCPKCGHGIIVTDRADKISSDEARRTWAMFDRMMKDMDAWFKKMPRFWKLK